MPVSTEGQSHTTWRNVILDTQRQREQSATEVMVAAPIAGRTTWELLKERSPLTARMSFSPHTEQERDDGSFGLLPSPPACRLMEHSVPSKGTKPFHFCHSDKEFAHIQEVIDPLFHSYPCSIHLIPPKVLKGSHERSKFRGVRAMWERLQAGTAYHKVAKRILCPMLHHRLELKIITSSPMLHVRFLMYI